MQEFQLDKWDKNIQMLVEQMDRSAADMYLDLEEKAFFVDYIAFSIEQKASYLKQVGNDDEITEECPDLEEIFKAYIRQCHDKDIPIPDKFLDLGFGWNCTKTTE